jgi:hypothetical protein
MSCPFYTALSPIHGRGLYANQYFPVGSVLFKVADQNGQITNLGKYVNHSWTPNIILHKESDSWYAVASMPIFSGREIISNYQCAPKWLEKPKKYWH